MKLVKLSLSLFSLLLFASSCLHTPQKPIEEIVDEALALSAEQSLRMYEILENKEALLPRSIKADGELMTCKSSWWTSGFFPGTLWYLYENSQDQHVKKAALTMSERVKDQQYTTDNHDVGFIIMCSYGNAYRLTNDSSFIPIIEQTAQSLSTRFSSEVGCIKSWDNKKWSFPVIIDNMMNLELLTTASRLTGNKDYYRLATSHADKTRECHFRPDGSSFHLVNYDQKTGDVLNQQTVQGFSDSSSWARGQAWGLYGYTMMYRETGDKTYLDFAQKIANYLMYHPGMPSDKIPYWDFNCPDIPHTYRDASAGAIIASALIELSTLVDDKIKEKEYLGFAQQQIRSLASDNYMAKPGENRNFILKHSVGFKAKGYELDVPLSYADYYFVEALVRYKRILSGNN
ncbi:MAG: glycoside hydrolase family 88 protein [Bacteroidales bacterium]